MKQIWINWAFSDNPREFLLSMEANGILEPELKSLVNVPQDEKHHPEGSVWQHTLWVVDAAKDIAIRDNLVGEARLVLMFAALTHDFGKPSTTEFNVEKGYITAYGHDKAGVAPATSFLQSIGASEQLIALITPLVATHMDWIGFHTPSITDKSVRKLLRRIAPNTVYMWQSVVEADISGRPPLTKGLPARAMEIIKVAERIENDDSGF